MNDRRDKQRPLTIARLVLLALVTSLVLSACSSGGEEATDPGATPDGDGGLIVTAPLNAVVTGFDPVALEVPADTALTITFDNDDAGIPHNIQIFAGADPTGEVLWAPEDNAAITGPASVDYSVPAMSAGTYAFNCFLHPTTMVGAITVT